MGVSPHPTVALLIACPAIGFSVSEAIKTVLYVEDDADDVFFFRRALKGQKVSCDLQVVSNVTDAKCYLAGHGDYSDRSRFPMPAVLLTDSTIKTPDGSSIDLVSWIRSQPAIRGMPIVCVTGNNDPEVLRQFGELGVNCHFKTADMAETAQHVKAVLEAEDCP